MGNAILEESCSISAALPGLLRLSLPAHSLFPPPSSSCPLQVLLLFSLTPNYLCPLCPISSHYVHFIQLFSLTCKLSLWFKADSWGALQSPRKDFLCSPGESPHLSRSPVPAHFGFCAEILSLTAANTNRIFLPAVGRSFCWGELGPIPLPLFLRFTSHFMMNLNKKIKWRKNFIF